ncbi:MAG: L,D-transpeptidase, partial [Deltaproteobacteria bacterium]
PIESGIGGVCKRRSGYHRNTVGDNEISRMASRNSAKGHRIIDKKSWCKENRFIYATTGPPLEKLWTESYGGEQATVMSINYPNLKDARRGCTGDCIHIHACKSLKNGALTKSYGCIHMFPKDAAELYEFVDVGVPVKIIP